MPLLCVGDASHLEADNEQESDSFQEQDECICIWHILPDSILLQIFSFLDVPDLGCVAKTCKKWKRVSLDESLWRSILHSKLSVTDVELPSSKCSWLQEVKRICYHTPVILTETLKEHTDEVLHVSFSHDGKLFSTTSKDATLKVWTVHYPTAVKYSKDFRELLGWDFTQFSCFNESDTMVLVSSVKTISNTYRRGYVAVLSIIHDFDILHVVAMDPSQLFGAWFDDTTFLGGSLEISLDRFATNVQIVAHEVPEIVTTSKNKAFVHVIKETAGRPVFTFCSETSSLIKFLTVATFGSSDPGNLLGNGMHSQTGIYNLSNGDHLEQGLTPAMSFKKPSISCSVFPSSDLMGCVERASFDKNVQQQTLANTFNEKSVILGSNFETCDDLEVDVGFREMCQEVPENMNIYENTKIENTEIVDSCYEDGVARCSEFGMHSDKKVKKLIFVTGEFAVALHQIGFKNLPTCRQNLLSEDASQLVEDDADGLMVINYSNNDIHIVSRHQTSEKPDHLIDMFGHITGLCLTSDHRYLFINCRPWIGSVDKTDPWATPDLSPNLEVRIIDLWTYKDLGIRYVGHKGFSSSTMCCFVFLDVSQDFVASGSEDSKGYIWDRHYCSILSTFDHESGVVNAVGFSPTNQEYLVTVSDDKTIKVWRSKHEVKCLQIDPINVNNS